MIKNHRIKAPTKTEKIIIRIMIALGLLSIIYFYFQVFFLNQSASKVLFILLVTSISYDSLRLIYMWYHYSNMSIPQKPIEFPKLSVDVFTTYFPGEPHEMVKTTLKAIQKINYPHKTYLCDEANDKKLKKYCDENNIIHVTRNNRKDAKAGNINNALKLASGEICLILDPDHIPEENFLSDIIPYFADKTIGFVQSVQGYYNTGQSLVAKGAAEQTYHYYGPILMNMNSFGTVNAIGANCVFRRKALDSIGGHAAGLAEDMHTSMQLHAKKWKSIYVPQEYTKGLVPFTLSSFYKQQLKWARGTLELLVTTYPKLFKRFTWHQKLHYAILPFHYFSGIICLINFLIPILSLFLATAPWKGNIANFSLVVLPVFTSIFGLRIYIQKWVIKPRERGMHLIGGLLLNATWWIYTVGLIYTIFRKEVPFLPTLKDDTNKTNWKILIPNLSIGIISVLAIIYGLLIDYTPFSIIMSGIAAVNAFFMFYTIVFAYQKQKNSFEKTRWKEKITEKLKNGGFKFARAFALPMVTTVFIFALVTNTYLENTKWKNVKPRVQNKNKISYFGIFSPSEDDGLSSVKWINSISKKTNSKVEIIPLYLAWNEKNISEFPDFLIDSIYSRSSIPLITWEPWLNDFEKFADTNNHIFDFISEGYFDGFISKFAQKLKSLNHPVLLRFAHEFDNPFYPWYQNEHNASEKFKTAWIHVYELFKKNRADNVIWIWNPWKAENIASYYPGKEYVDWIGINVLDYNTLNQSGQSEPFDSLYIPFHRELKKLPPAPVIISEMGSLSSNSKLWVTNAFQSAENSYPEIKSIILFYNKFDKNIPQKIEMDSYLDWTFNLNNLSLNDLQKENVPGYVFTSLPDMKRSQNISVKLNYSLPFKNTRGINIKNGTNWKKDYYVLNRRTLLADLKQLKNVGINTVKFSATSVYAKNVLRYSKDFDLNLVMSFWIQSDIDFEQDTLKTKQLEQIILKKISQYKNHRSIIAWNIQNDVLYNQKDYFHKPELLYQNDAYIKWLKKLIIEIKKISSTKPIIIDIEVSRQTASITQKLIESVDVDILGLVVKNSLHLNEVVQYLKQHNLEYIFSEADVETVIKNDVGNNEEAFFIKNWRDQHENNKIVFNGIVDFKGREKEDFYNLSDYLHNTESESNLPVIRILKPATVLLRNNQLNYYALYYTKKTGWKFGSNNENLRFKWSLIKCDQYGNFLAIKDFSDGARLSLNIPDDYNFFRLLLTATNGRTVKSVVSTLNTPLDLKNSDVSE